MKQQIDILLTTHNGARTLPLMLDALAEVQAPQRAWRILVVDNASTDETPEILRKWAGRLPLTILHCPTPGKAAAQAFGATFLEGDLIILTDDDILPDTGWLRALERAADKNPTASIFGGGIEPRPIEPVTGWYEAARDYYYDLFGRISLPYGVVSGADTIFGPSMMMRQAEAMKALSRSDALGPTFTLKGGKRVFPLGDESEMIARLERAGAVSVFTPDARVGHMVRAFQTELPFMLQRAQNHGRGVAIRTLGETHPVLHRAAMAISSALRVPWLYVRSLGKSRGVPERATFNNLYGLNWHLGRLKGALFGPFSKRH